MNSDYKNISPIYHGSDIILKNPSFGEGSPDNDYGSGFYTTQDINKAIEWALINGDSNSAICNKYVIHNEDEMNILYLDEYGELAWIAEIAAHRGVRNERTQITGEKIVEKYKIDTDNADIIIGYRADDSYTSVVEAFLLNEINIDEVRKLFVEGKLGEQVFIKSEKAFDSIEFIEYKDVCKLNEIKLAAEKNEAYARKKVEKFLQNRREQIYLYGYEPDGITAKKAIQFYYVYDKNYHYYYQADEKEIKNENKSLGLEKYIRSSSLNEEDAKEGITSIQSTANIKSNNKRKGTGAGYDT